MNSQERTEFPTFFQPPTSRGQERWRKALDTAKRLFMERDYNDVSLAEIVRESGGSFSTLYKWFGGKDELFLCVIIDHISHASALVESIETPGPTAEDDVRATVEKLVANGPFQLARHVFLETRMFKEYRSKMLELIERNTNVPIAGLFGRIRKERGVEFILSDEELALTLVRFFRGLFLELALDETQIQSRLEQGKRLITDVLISLIRNAEGARQ